MQQPPGRMWADAADDEPIREHRLVSFVLDVVGRTRTQPVGKYAFVRTARGWSQRLVAGDDPAVRGFNHDYVSHETIDDLSAWWKIDFARATMTEALHDGAPACDASFADDEPDVADQ